MAQQEIINLLSEMVKIPSISSDKDHRDDVDASAQFVEGLFADLGLNTQVIKVRFFCLDRSQYEQLQQAFHQQLLLPVC